MGIVARQTIKASFVIYVAALVGAMNRLYFYPKFVSKEELGILQLVIILGTLLSQFSFLGMSTALSKYFKMFKDAGYLGQLLFLFFAIKRVDFWLIFLFYFPPRNINFWDTIFGTASYFIFGKHTQK